MLDSMIFLQILSPGYPVTAALLGVHRTLWHERPSWMQNVVLTVPENSNRDAEITSCGACERIVLTGAVRERIFGYI